MWNRVACNPNYEDFLKEKETRRFVKSLHGIKSIVDTSGPKNVPHLKKRSKKAQLREARQEEINFTNRVLMDKIFSIDSRANSKRNSSNTHSLNKNSRSKNNVRINEENQKILERLQQAQPALSLQQWEKDERNWRSIRNNIIKSNNLQNE